MVGTKLADPFHQPRHSEEIGHHVMSTRVSRLIVSPGVRQEPHETGIVHGLDRRCPPPIGLPNLVCCIGGEHLVDRVGAARVFEGVLEPRRLDFGERSVLPLTGW